MRTTLAAVAVVLAVGGCTATDEPDDDAKVAWAGELCAAAGTAALDRPPPAADPADPAAVRSAVTAYLESVTAGLTAAVDGVEALGPSPIDGGDALADRLAAAYRGLREPFDAQLAALRADPGPGVALTALAAVVPRITSLGELAVGPGSEFTRWAERAPRCAAVPTLRS
ncbi:hypothetical protein [Actinokineospora pegani]|uniref:hypothetical protein n=1 Tax=Actinokineospora pegani TaxID=2654637 RepID=UPI0012E9CB77|nr:hypothetical protein [Actinokineospora pegani]